VWESRRDRHEAETGSVVVKLGRWGTRAFRGGLEALLTHHDPPRAGPPVDACPEFRTFRSSATHLRTEHRTESGGACSGGDEVAVSPDYQPEK
jgi:hypothetical protein